MAAMLLAPLNAIFAALAPMKSAWVLPVVFSGMTVAVTTLIECRARLVALTGTAMIGAALVSGGARWHARPAPRRQRTAARRGIPASIFAPNCWTPCPMRGGRLVVRAPAWKSRHPAGLTLGVQPGTLRPVLLALLRNAIEHAPGGKVFVGAIRADGEMRIVIIDDGPVVAEPLTGDARTSLARLLALSDASLLVDHRPGDGTTVMLCLPDKA